jgi:Phage tail lysozyme
VSSQGSLFHGTARQLEATKFLVSKGYCYKDQQGRLVVDGSAAIVGNLSQESGNNLDATVHRRVADHGSGGIAEWRLDRLTRLEKFAEDHGLNVADLKTQLLYLIWELDNFYPALNASLKTGGRSIANLTANFMQMFERPSVQYANLDNRIKQANICTTAFAADLAAKKPPVPETIGAGATAAGGAIGAGVAWFAGLSGPVIAGLVTLAAAAAVILGFYLFKRVSQPSVVSVAPSNGTSAAVEDLRAAVAEMKAAHDRVEAAKAVLIADRAEGDKLLEEVEGLQNG